MSDNYVYENANSTAVEDQPMTNKIWEIAPDSNGRSYNSGQVIITTEALANGGRYINYDEGFLQIPVFECVSATNGGAAVDLSNKAYDYLMAPKNAFQSIHSMSVEYNNDSVVTLANFQNIYCSFKAMTSFSTDDLNNLGPSIGFSPDTHDSWTYGNRGHCAGVGSCNSSTLLRPVVNAMSGIDENQFINGNKGMVQRQQWLNTRTTSTYGADEIAPSQNRNTVLTSVFASASGIQVRSYMMIIRLKDLHTDFFTKLGMVRGAVLRFTINFNNSVTVVTKNAGTATGGAAGSGTDTYGAAFDPKTPYYTINSSQALGTVPIMLASSIGASATSMSTGGVLPNGTVITLSYNVGDINYAPHKILVGGMVPNSVLPIRLYAPSYHMNPAREIQFLQQGTKRVTYRDIFSYQARNIGQGAFEVPVTNALANVKKVVVVPIFNQSSNGGISPLLSPFATEGATTSPLVGTLNSFNIRYGGSPFLNMDIKYGYEHFIEHVYGVNSINGGGSIGVNSGLLDFDKWQNNYQYYVINLSRRLKEEDRIPKAVHVVGNNNNLVNIDLYIFLEIEKEMVIDLATGARVA